MWYLVAIQKIFVKQIDVVSPPPPAPGIMLIPEFLGSCFFLISSHAPTLTQFYIFVHAMPPIKDKILPWC